MQKPDIAPATELIAKDGKYPTAMLMVFKLRGDFDAADVVKHGNVDANCRKSSSGSTSRRRLQRVPLGDDPRQLRDQRHPAARVQPDRHPHRFATGQERYLVQLTITSLAEQAVADSDEIEAIIAGFTVAAK